MKRVLLVFMLLAACSKAPEVPQARAAEDVQRQAYAAEIKSGVSPEVIRQTMADAKNLPQMSNAELDYRVKQKQKTLDGLHAAVCKNEPYLDQCAR